MRGRALVLVAVLVGACQQAPATPAPGSESPLASSGLPSEGVTSPPPVTGVVGPGDFVLADPLVGLDALASYRASLTMSFAGTAGGQSRTWSMSTELVVASPTAGVLTTTTTGDIDPQLMAGTSGWSAARDGAIYALDTDGRCMASAASGSPLPQPAGELIGLIGAELAGRETVDGIEVDSYAFDQRALGFRSTAQATGRVSIATNGGHVVRYDLTTTGGADYFGEGIEGTLVTAYALSETGGAASVDLPDDCPPGEIAATIPTDATDTIREPGFLSYRVAAPLARAVDIVRGNAVIDHWSAGPSRIVKGGAHLEYTAGTLQLHVWIRSVEGAALVEIVGAWAQP